MAFCALAQSPYSSRRGQFQVDEKKGCASPTAPFTITVDSAYPCGQAGTTCGVEWGDGSPGGAFSDLSSHTYTTPGKYTLQILVLSNLDGPDDIEIEVLPDTPPEFDVYLCESNQVSVKVTDQNYNQYVINYGDGLPDDIVARGNNAVATHDYAGNAGVNTITVKGRNLNADDNCTPASEQITTIGNFIKPSINLLQVLNKDSIQLDFTTQPNVLYRLEIAVNSAAPFQTYKTIYNTSSIILTDLKPDDNYYCFRLGAYDPCQNSMSAPDISDVICSSNFDLSVQNNSNNLTWITNASGVFDFRLNRTTSAGALGRNIDKTQTSFSDEDINCGTEYCYQLTSNYTNGSRSISMQKCGTAISTDIPETVQNITAVVGDPEVTLQWPLIQDFTPAEFSVFRSQNGTVTDLLSKTPDFQITDDAYRTESSTCYIISYEDVCGNASLPSAEACPIRLTGTVKRDNVITLDWTAYTGWRSGVTDYTIEKYSMDGQLLETFSPGTNLTQPDESQDDLANQSYLYIVKANPAELGLPQAVSNSIIITKNSNIFYPTAFTPNSDNLNDLFNVFGQYIVTFEMNIFNRWGELVFSSTALEQGWDGTFKNNPMPEGTYTFVADITDRAGRSFKKSGSVLLLRKR
jgi:gliding motility-associated-like protein